MKKQKITLTEEQTADIIAAEVLGQQGFVNGKKAACQDKAAMDLIAKYSTPDFRNHDIIVGILNSWNKGFHTANLVGDIQ
jgi:hypothetical protein